MVEHFCEKHQTKFFKKGGMKGYAHPIGDTGKWCNEENPGEEKSEEQKPNTTQPEKFRPSKPPTTTDAHVAFRGGIELLTNKIITPDSELGKKVLKWASDKL